MRDHFAPQKNSKPFHPRITENGTQNSVLRRAIVPHITASSQAERPKREQMDELELEKFVDYVYRTPSGGILHLKNGAAIIIRDNVGEILSSLEEYHAKYKDDSSIWIELTNDQDKKKLYHANTAALTKIKWIDVETVVTAAKELEAAETRKSFMANLKGLLNDLLRAIVYFPLVIFIIWGFNFGLKRYLGAELWHVPSGVIGAVGTAVILNFFPKNGPGRVAVIVSVCGYLLIVLVIWKFG
jgi:hypothetical protein